RAARREKRDKRDKRDKRREREARIDGAAPTEAPDSGVGAITLGASGSDAALVPSLSVVRTELEVPPPDEPSEGVIGELGSPRKRKRRRRRGSRDRATGAESPE